MSEYTKGLLKHGFLNKKGEAIKADMNSEEWKKFVDKLSDSDAEKYADEEIDEEASIQPGEGSNTGYFRTGYPVPIKRYRLMYESFNNPVEEMYFWVLSQLRREQHYHVFHKITDVFTASEQSAFWGAAQTRMKIQQDNVSQYLVTIGKMIKDLFQIVRELRIIDERKEIYDNWKDLKSADVTLKGLYIDLVEGASKNPGSVYGLAQQVGFTILPDLFFNTHVYSSKEVDSVVDASKYNQAVKNVLKRKLFSFVTWKEKTHAELESRRKFQLKYLRQHWVVIKMYMDWIKPYLRNIRRMQMNERLVESVDIISAFETSMIEIEFLAEKPGKVKPVIIASFEYRTRPDMSFQQDNYQHRGPIHVGRCMMHLRAYTMTDKQIENYKKYRQEESVKLFSVIDESVQAAMEALGDELEGYLKEAGEPVKEKAATNKAIKKKRKANYGMLEPFIAVLKGVGEMFGTVVPTPNISVKKSSSSKEGKIVDSKAKKVVLLNMWLCYKNYKKSKRMITW